MRFVLFGQPPGPVLDIVKRLRFDRIGGGAYVVQVGPEQLPLARQWGLIDVDAQPGTIAQMGERMTLLDEKGTADLTAIVAELLPTYKSLLAATTTRVQQAFAATSAALEQGIMWDDVAHVLVVGWLMDLGLTHAIRQAGGIEALTEWRILAFPIYPANAIDCGVRLQYGPSTMLGELWIDAKRRQPPIAVNLTPDDFDVLNQLVKDGGNVAAATFRRRASLRKLCYLGVLDWNGACYRPAIPLFFESDCTLLLPPVLAAAAQAAELVGHWMGELANSVVVPGAAYRLGLLRLLLTRSFAELMADSVLPGMPRLLPRSWGLWLVLGQDLPDMFHPFRAREG